MNAAVAAVADCRLAPALASVCGPFSASTRWRLEATASSPRRRQSACARQLAAVAATHLLQHPVGADQLVEQEGPGIRVRGIAGLHLSLSHSGNFAAAIVATDRCGIDIERCQADRDFSALAALVFAPGEIAWMERADSAQRAARFYVLWTRREAAIKAGTGEGEAGSTVNAQGARLWLPGASRAQGNSALLATVVVPPCTEIEWLLPGPSHARGLQFHSRRTRSAPLSRDSA